MNISILSSITAAIYLTYRTALAHCQQPETTYSQPQNIELRDHPVQIVPDTTHPRLENLIRYYPADIARSNRMTSLKRTRHSGDERDDEVYLSPISSIAPRSRVPRYDLRRPKMRQRVLR